MLVPEHILSFWFDEAGPQKWYKGGDSFDALIRERFEVFTVQAAAAFEEDAEHPWEEKPASALALIILLDQFCRNMYRGTKGAFAFDDLALTIAQRAVGKGFDLKLPQGQRAFFYMPYMHAEDIAMQDECVRLAGARLESENTLFHAREHQKLIVKFGRFPHRNKILGRASTQEELTFLYEGGYTP